jgi:secreted PhoX family phosphatase
VNQHYGLIAAAKYFRPYAPQMPEVDRRAFLQLASGVSLAFAGLHTRWLGVSRASLLDVGGPIGPHGPLIPDPAGLIDLPAGFTYHVFSQRGEEMNDGLLVPGQHDGMAAFPGPGGTTVLIRNHEISAAHRTVGPFGAHNERLDRVDQQKIYDLGRTPFGTKLPSRGGCTRIVYDTRRRELLSHRLILAGTDHNCAGGPTPRGTWISCEETTVGPEHGLPWQQPHGYCFEVSADLDTGLVKPQPIKSMGRFRHEAVAVNPQTGIVYLSEDLGDGLMYRYLPNDPAKLLEGGRLQAMAMTGRLSADTRDWEGVPPWSPGDVRAVHWIDVEDVDSADDSLRYQGFEKGAARFARAEGMWHGNNEIFFACTTGGRAKAGQLWRYRPSPPEIEGTSLEHERPATLELFLQPDDPSVLENADNITQSPGGDLVVCEDGGGEQFLLGVTSKGTVYPIARNAMSNTEFAGCCYSPDGSTLFVNLQRPGLTLAITHQPNG